MKYPLLVILFSYYVYFITGQQIEAGRRRGRRQGRGRRVRVGREGRGMEGPRRLARAEILAQQQARREERRQQIRVSII